MSRPRSAPLAALTLALTAPLSLALAPPAFAAGGSAVVGAVVTDGNVNVVSTKGLSRVTVVLCGGDTVVADSWSNDQKIGDVKVDGIVQAVFIHSGDNTTSAAQALLALLAGADAVKGNSTGAIALHDEDACEVTTTSSSSTTTTTSTTVTTGSSTTTTTTGTDSTTTTTTTDGSTTTTTGTTDSSTTTTTAAGGGGGTTTTTGVQTLVLGETLEKSDGPSAAVSPGGLARTGAGYVMFLVTLGLGLVGLGVALVSVFRRRPALSASSPG